MNQKHLRAFMLWASVTACTWFGSPALARAAHDVFIVQDLVSWFRVSGTADVGGAFYGLPLSEQGANSLYSGLTGTLNVNTDIFTTLALSGGSNIVPDVNGAWSPGPGGTNGTQPAQYGTLIDAGYPYGLHSGVNYATKSAAFDVTSSPIALTTGTFDSTQATLTLLTATIDYQAFGLIIGSGTDVVTNESAPNTMGGGNVFVEGNLVQITIPIHAMQDYAISSSVSHTTISGAIVAYHVFAQGDTNFDGIVNGQDVSLVASHWLHSNPTLSIPGDANGDHIVNGQDIVMIASNWLHTDPGVGGGGGGAANVPEPATLVLVVIGGFPLLAYPRRFA